MIINIAYYSFVYSGGNTLIVIDLGTIEYYDDETNEFIYENGGLVRFEYSLKALYDWEAEWKKPFLKGNLTNVELKDFYLKMALDPIDDKFLTDEVSTKLSEYIADPNTATSFSSGQNGDKAPTKAKIYTSEELYALMFMERIPIDFEHRNLNRLLTILRIISNYREPPKKMSKQDIYRQNAELNKMRREQMNTKG